MRFIEFMPLDADRKWSHESMVSGAQLRSMIESEIGPLHRIARLDSAQPSTDYRLNESSSVIGFIDSVTTPFCESCNRIRLTADGKLRNCLFGQDEWDIRELLMASSSDEAIVQRVRDCVDRKHPSHGISSDGFQPPKLAMYQIGG